MQTRQKEKLLKAQLDFKQSLTKVASKNQEEVFLGKKPIKAKTPRQRNNREASMDREEGMGWKVRERRGRDHFTLQSQPRKEKPSI